MTVRERSPKIEGPVRFVFWLVLVLVSAVLGGWHGAPSPERAAEIHHELHRAKHVVVTKQWKHLREHPEKRSDALYDDDDDDDDDEVGLAAPSAPDDPDDASPAPAHNPLAEGPLPLRDIETEGTSTAGLGPAVGHLRPDEHPPRA